MILNISRTGELDVRRNTTLAVFDPRWLQEAGFSGRTTILVSLNSSSSPKADPVLLGQLEIPGTLDDYREFDVDAWRQERTFQRFQTVLDLSGGDSSPYFLTLFNGFYSQQRLRYEIVAEIVSAGACPRGLGACSGRGVCENSMCSCNPGFTGILCELNVTDLSYGNGTLPAHVPTQRTIRLDPGTWQYFVLDLSRDIEGSIRQFNISLNRVEGGLNAQGLFVAAFDSSRRPSSITKLTSEAAAFPFDGYTTKAPVQTILLRRGSSEDRFLYIGVHNGVWARAAFVGELRIGVYNSIITPPCTNASYRSACDMASCSGHGSFTLIGGRPACTCERGWSSATDCASPFFSSFAKLLSAAQRLEPLCSVCVHNAIYNREELQLFTVPQTLQKKTALSLTVRSYNGTESARRLGSWDPRILQGSTVTVGGIPSLLVSPRFPRSILDFTFIAPSGTTDQYLVLDSTSPSGFYVTAVYANTAGSLEIQAARALVNITRIVGPDFSTIATRWLMHTMPGKIVLGFSGILGFIIIVGLIMQCFAGRDRQKSRQALKEVRRYRLLVGNMQRMIESHGAKVFADIGSIKKYAQKVVDTANQPAFHSGTSNYNMVASPRIVEAPTRTNESDVRRTRIFNAVTNASNFGVQSFGKLLSGMLRPSSDKVLYSPAQPGQNSAGFSPGAGTGPKKRASFFSAMNPLQNVSDDADFSTGSESAVPVITVNPTAATKGHSKARAIFSKNSP
jgi:hypothetical protein